MSRVKGIALVLCFIGCCAKGQSSGDSATVKYSEDGQKALAAGRYDVAEADFLALQKIEPGIAEVHATLGLIYFQEKKFDLAVTEIRQAQKLKPGLVRLDSLLAMSLSEVGHYNEALPGLTKAFKQSNDPAVRRMSGLQLMRAYTELRQDDKAVETALQLNQLYPKDPEVLYNTGKVYGSYAFLTIQKLSTDAPNSVWRHLASAEAYESEGAANQALGEYHNVLALDPHRRGIHYRMGRTFLAQFHQTGAAANLDDARKEFAQELELDPRNGNAAYEIAEMDRQAGQFDLAEQFFERALDNYPDFEEARVGLAAVYLSEDKPAQALPLLKAAIAQNPNDEVSWYRLSQVERTLGHRTEQQEALAHFHELHQASLAQQATTLPSTSDVTKQELGPDANP
jgi:predicted Zn-dependent protease